jgi:folate-binding protein YgfZ
MQRMTSQDVQGLVPGQGIADLLLSSKGRMLAAFDALALDGGLLLVLADDRTAELVAVLERFRFSEDVRLVDVTGELAELIVTGPGAARTLELADGALPRAAGSSLPDDGRRDTIEHTLAGIAVRVGLTSPLAGTTYRLLVPAGVAGAVREHLLARRGVGEANAEQAEVMRVEAGVPAPGREITERFNPLEAGLVHAVSFTKGCFTGQEVVARLRNFRKVQRRLRQVALAGTGVPPTGTPIEIGDQVVGEVTSSVRSPRHGGALALGYVSRDHLAPGTGVTVAGAPGELQVPPAATFEDA